MAVKKELGDTKSKLTGEKIGLFAPDTDKQIKINGLLTLTKALLANKTLSEMRTCQVKTNIKELSRKLIKFF